MKRKSIQSFSYIINTLKQVEDLVKKNNEQFQKQLTTLTTDVAIIKNIISDMKKEVFGNGKEGLNIRTTKLEEKVMLLDRGVDKAVTTDEVLQARFRTIEMKIIRWSGIILGINLTIGAIIAWMTNWDKIALFFHIGGH